MSQMILPKQVLDDLISFVSRKYSNCLPNSLLVAQAFILAHQYYGREFGLTVINEAIEEGIKQGLFDC
jgi:hypothetical protein